MRILHLAAHLGGGVGKAHAAMAPYMPADIEQTFLLLQEPIDRQYVDAIMAAGCRVALAGSKCDVEAFSKVADVMQFEFWGHPALDEMVGRWRPPAGMPTVCWCHVATAPAPYCRFFGESHAHRFVATSQITRVPYEATVINSGFGFEDAVRPPHRWAASRFTQIVYLGTVDFKKMHPGFFDAVDHLADLEKIYPVVVWGRASEEAQRAAAAMRRPELVELRGYTSNPHDGLNMGDIFFYPLRRGHYGTAENALIEAMSLGLVPVVLDNPAEASIVEDGETGIVAFSMPAAVRAVARLINDPALRLRLSRNAAAFAKTRSPYTSARQFADLWRSMVRKERAVA